MPDTMKENTSNDLFDPEPEWYLPVFENMEENIFMPDERSESRIGYRCCRL